MKSPAAKILCAFLLLLQANISLGQTILNGYFVETDGMVIIEAESITPLINSWVDADNSTAPNVSEPEAATGDGYIVWEGRQQLNNTGQGTLVYPVQINTPGEYQFCWRSQVGKGSDSTDHNDSWLKIDADAFYGFKNNGGTTVCPIGLDPDENDCRGFLPFGPGSNGWFKVYSFGTTGWTFTTRTSDNDAHKIFARFDTPGIYNIRVSARSSFHLIDRMTLSASGGCIEDLSMSESEYVDLNPLFYDGFEW